LGRLLPGEWRGHLAVAGILAATALTISCGNPQESHDPTTISQLVNGDERLLGPWGPLPQQYLVFLPLFEQGFPDSPYQLSESWEVSEDGRTWTFHLREDARWQDGVPVTAADVAFTAELFNDPAVTWRSERATTLEVVDDRTVVFQLHRSDWSWNIDAVYPKHLLEDLDPAEFQTWPFWSDPVGSGAYRYDRFIPDAQVELVVDTTWAGPRPPVERFRFRFGGQPVVLLEAGEIDMARGEEVVLLARGRPDLRVQVGNGFSGHTMIWWNHNRPPLDDARIRRALDMAIDRREVMSFNELPVDVPVVDVPITGRQWKERSFPPPLGHDPERARALLAEAGWVDRDQDGVVENRGRELHLELNVHANAADNAVLIQDQLSRIGVAVELRTVEYNAWNNRWSRGLADATFGPMNGGLPWIAVNLLDPVATGYVNSDLAVLATLADTTFLDAVQDSAYESAWEIFHREVPVTLVYPLVGLSVIREDVLNLWDRHLAEYEGRRIREDS
jgi:peptide/nickel transport system substrate-binding protein